MVNDAVKASTLQPDDKADLLLRFVNFIEDRAPTLHGLNEAYADYTRSKNATGGSRKRPYDDESDPPFFCFSFFSCFFSTRPPSFPLQNSHQNPAKQARVDPGVAASPAMGVAPQGPWVITFSSSWLGCLFG